jgi:hypothetical protein
LKKYVKIFSNFWGYADQHIPNCWYCNKSQAVEIHHIENKKMGGNKTKDRIDNLIPLCRKHHEESHQHKITKKTLKDKLMEKINAKTNH